MFTGNSHYIVAHTCQPVKVTADSDLSDTFQIGYFAQMIQYYTLSDWRSKRNAAAKAKNYHMSDDEANKRIEELEREIVELRKANEILKDALGFFAKDRKK